jgi:hypothetical protein
MLEREIQTRVIYYARSKRMICYKMDATNAIGVPDYLLLTAGGDVFFIEFKQLGKKPTPMQEREHARLRANNIKVYVIDTVEAGKVAIDECSGGL